MKSSIFRKYDIRGIVDQDIRSGEWYVLGQAIACYLLGKSSYLEHLVIARDGRNHSKSIHQEIVQGILDSGINVVDIGLCPSPVLYFTLHNSPYSSGLIITASHNGAEFNGIKLYHEKKAIWNLGLQEIARCIEMQTYKVVPQKSKGTISDYEATKPYVDYLHNSFHLLTSQIPSCVFDTLHGAAGPIMQLLIKKMGWTHSILHAQVDGNFPACPPDPTIPSHLFPLSKEIKKEKKNYGIAFDGDGDRMAVITRQGRLLKGDELLALFALFLQKELPSSLISIVCDSKCSNLLFDICAEKGIICHMTSSGHTVIKEEMIKRKALIGGELSCHFFFADKYFGYDDGIYAALRFLEIDARYPGAVQDFLEQIPFYFSSPEIRLSCPPATGNIILNNARTFFSKKKASITETDGVRAMLPYGWNIVRYSNTQNALSLRFESASQEGFLQLKENLKEILYPYIDQRELESNFDELCS